MRHAVGMTEVATGTIHYIELWVPDLANGGDPTIRRVGRGQLE